MSQITLDHLADSPVFSLLKTDNRGILVIEENGNVLYGNPSICEMLGYKFEDIVQQTIFNINPLLSLMNWKKMFRQSQEKRLLKKAELYTSKGVLFPAKTEIVQLKLADKAYCIYTVKNLIKANRFKDLLHLISDLSQIGAWEYDLVSDRILLTDQIYSIIEQKNEKSFYSKKEFKEFASAFFLAQDFELFMEKTRWAINTCKDFQLELTLQLKTGQQKPVLLTAVTKEAEPGEKAPKLSGTLQDISQVTRRSNEMYMAEFTVDHSPAIIFWIKSDASIYYANQISAEKLGWTKNQIQQLKVFDIGIRSPENFNSIWERFRENEFLNYETQLKRRDGSTFPVDMFARLISYQEEEYLICHCLDKSDKLELDRLIGLFYLTLNQSQELILWCRQDGTIYFQNETLVRRSGYEVEEIDQMSFQDLIEDLNFDHLWKEDNNLSMQECYLVSKEGEKIPLEVNLNFIRHQGEKLVCFSMHDVSDSRNKEIELQETLMELSSLKEKVESEKNYLQEEITTDYSFNNIISKSPSYRKVLTQVARVADSDATVLLTGETGTGKELLARAVHSLSMRSESPMIKVNCAALPENLIESELFGHEKGAFTGAYQRKIGRFELADKGTIFLDEIGELPLELQAKLLRVLQEGEFERLGNPKTLHTDVRIIAATNRNLEKLVQKGKFREDLFYRLNVFPIYNIPLRERREDIPLLIQHFVNRYSKKTNRKITKIPGSFVETLQKYEFPGNIRELENIIERSIILSKDEALSLNSILPQLRKKEESVSKNDAVFLSFEEMQRQHILDALKRSNWKVTGEMGAADLLGLNGKTLASKMRKLGISRSSSNGLS